jgi:hypothetical protein
MKILLKVPKVPKVFVFMLTFPFTVNGFDAMLVMLVAK